MKLYFPEIYPDELVYSWFCRYMVYSGCISSKAAIAQLLYSTKSNPGIESIGHLNKNAEEQIEQLYTLDTLIVGHTMFPQYARFLSLQKQKEALEKIKKYDNPHKAVTILPRSDKEKYLRYCPLCAKEDRAIYGETYWHRQHQIRNVDICPAHQCRLENSVVSAVTQRIFRFYPAEMEVKDITPVFVADKDKIGFAKYAVDLFKTAIVQEDVQIRAVIFDVMVGTKYMRGQHRNMAQFADDLQAYFEKMGINTIVSMNQVQRVMLGESSEFSAICQIAYFLGIKLDDLLKSNITEEKVILEQKSHYVKNRVIGDWKKFDKENVVRFEKFCRGIYDGTAKEDGRPERVSERMIYRYLGVTYYGFKNMPECMNVYKKYVESYEESWARKVVWAYKKLKEGDENRNICWSDLRKLSGVKKKYSVDMCIYLKQYADKATYDSIMQLLKKN